MFLAWHFAKTRAKVRTFIYNSKNDNKKASPTHVGEALYLLIKVVFTCLQ